MVNYATVELLGCYFALSIGIAIDFIMSSNILDMWFVVKHVTSGFTNILLLMLYLEFSASPYHVR